LTLDKRNEYSDDATVIVSGRRFRALCDHGHIPRATLGVVHADMDRLPLSEHCALCHSIALLCAQGNKPGVGDNDTDTLNDALNRRYAA
jgi:hypothetical protein